VTRPNLCRENVVDRRSCDTPTGCDNAAWCAGGLCVRQS